MKNIKGFFSFMSNINITLFYEHEEWIYYASLSNRGY